MIVKKQLKNSRSL